MPVEQMDFDDLPEEEIPEKEKKITVSIKLTEDARNMFQKIAHRERRNMMALGEIVIEDYINNYVEKYKKQKT